MNITVRQEKVGNYHLYIEISKFSLGYKVGICRYQSEDTCGYPISELVYPTIKQASKRYSYLKRKAKKGEI